MSNTRKDRLKEIKAQLDASFNKKTEVIQTTPEGIEFEKKTRSNPNNKINGQVVPGNLISFQNMKIDPASWAILFPNKTPEEIAKLADKPEVPKTPQMKKY